MGFSGAETLISSDQTWVLWTCLIVSASLSIYLEQRYKWANKISGCVLALIFMMVLSNLNIIPTKAPVYDTVWDYVVPLAVPMLLFEANIKKIISESGKMLLIFLCGSVGTFVGGFLAYFLLRDYIPFLNNIIPMFVGTYIGGSVNFIAMSESYNVSSEIVSAALVADNMLMALYFFILSSLPSLKFIKKNYRQPYEELVFQNSSGNENVTMAEKYWSAKEISLKNIAFIIGAAFVLVTSGTYIADFFKNIFSSDGNFIFLLLGGLLGNRYLIITTLTMLLVTFIPSFFKETIGAQEIGTYLIYIFFAVIGAPANLRMIITKAPLLLLVASVIIVVNMIFSLILGKIFDFSIEEIIIGSNANIGGPTTSAAMAVSKGWNFLIIPAILVGTFGYVVGNYAGILIGTILM